MASGAKRRSRRPTMNDVAALAGVSLATVSRVINASTPVDPALASRVEEAVARLGYRRDVQAAGLRRADRASASVGLILEDVGNPFFSTLHRGIEDVARARDVLLFAGSSDDDPARERALAGSFGAHGVDGLIVVPAGDDQRYLERERPVVFVDRPPRGLVADAVLSDNAGGVRAAVEHLRDAGHRRIGYLGDRPRLFTAAERLTGFRAAGGEEALVRMDAPPGPGTRELVALGATALICGQNNLTVGALHELGPDSGVALIGFDDVPLGDYVGVTVVAQDPRALGRAAAELLFDRLAGDTGPPRRVVLPTCLIPRGSGER